MLTRYSFYCLSLSSLAGLLGVPLAGQAQSPTVTRASLSPAANARSALRTTPVVVPFSQNIAVGTAGTIRVFSPQYRGRRTATTSTSANTVTLTPTVPATGSQVTGFKPGETVSVTVPASVQSTGGVAATKYVYQFTAAATGGTGSFGGSSDPAVGSRPYGIALGDVDSDGDLDFVTANSGSGSTTVSVRFNDGTGSFNSSSTITVGSTPYGVALGDVDGDGDLDLLAANYGGTTVSVRLNDGTGTFSGGSDPTVGSAPFGVAVGDVDGDGDLDLLAANNGSGTVSVRLNDGTGTFSGSSNPAVGSAPLGVAVGDVDGDGDLDLLAANNTVSGTVNVCLNDGSGTFGGSSAIAVGSRPFSVALGDVDADGDLDLVTANYSAMVSVRLNDGTGTFGGGSDPLVGSRPYGAVLGDVDGDGDLDLLAANYSSGTVSVRLNDGTGTFGGGSDPAVGTNPVSVAVGDVDGDGDLDLLAANNGSSGTVSVRLNQDRLAISGFTPASGAIGTVVTITGTSFTGVTAVSFNGVAATNFTVNSASQLVVTVPAGATTGPISLTGPTATAASSSSYTVLPLALSGSQTNAASCTSADGTATVTASGGSLPYTYNWSTSPAQTMPTATGLAPGSYTVTVTDNAGTQLTRTFAIGAAPDTAPPVAVAQNVTLTLDATGTATLTPAQVDNGSTDNCGIATRTLSRTSFTCADVRANYALNFDGTNDWVNANTSTAKQSATSLGLPARTITLEAWVKPRSFANWQSAVAFLQDNGSDEDGWDLELGNNGRFRFALNSVAGGGLTYLSSANAFNVNTWYHLAGVYDGTTMKLYVNGVLEATSTAESGNIRYVNSWLAVGMYKDDDEANSFPGTLDEVRIWNVARSQSDIQATMNTTLQGTETGLVSYWKMDNGPGSSTLTDATGAHPGTLTNMNSNTDWVAGAPALTGYDVPVTLTVADAAGNSSTATATVRVQRPSAASIPTLAWTGAAGTSWSDCGNWSYGLVPEAGSSVSIPAGRPNYPVLSGTSLTVANLSIDAGASLAMGSTVLNVTGNLLNAGPALSGPVQLTGTGSQALAGNFSSLTIDKASGTTTLSADASVSTALTLTSGGLATGSYSVTLGSGALLTESTTNYVAGTVQTTRPVGTAGTAQNFGGLGLTLTPSGSTLPGTTLVKRVTGMALSGQGTSVSIKRYYDIQPAINVGLNVTVQFGYLDAELNNITEANLGLFRSATGPSGPWQAVAATSRNATANTVTSAVVDHFSIWTLGNQANPLPVTLVSFTAQAEGPAARLRWATASEVNSARFELERSADGRSFVKIGEVAAQGTPASATAYTFRDAVLPNLPATYYYRLRQVDLDGTATYSPVQAVAFADEQGENLTLVPNPAHASLVAMGLVAGDKIQVFDALGRVVLQAQAAPDGQASLVLPAGLAPGVYVVRSGSQARRLVVE